MLSRFLRGRRQPDFVPALPDGRRVYAIGDVHGCSDLLRQLLGMIARDDHARGPAETTVILLGDLVDRGPDSAGVFRVLREAVATGRDFRFLAGNHEEIFLGAHAGDAKMLKLFCRVGGRETMLSYGIGEADYDRMDYDAVTLALRTFVPTAHIDFVNACEDMIVIGDYAFVHAGIDPRRPLDDQSGIDLRWIRGGFLDHAGPLEKHVVHGHTIVDEVERRAYRTNIDTGAYESGRLTALGLEGTEQWTLCSTRDTLPQSFDAGDKRVFA